MSRRNTWRAVRVGVAAVAVGIVAAAGFALPASATSGSGNIDPKAPRSLTIHKYEQPDSGDLGPNNGSKIDVPAGSNPLGDVTFSVQRVTSIDLLTTAGWDAADDLTAAQVLAKPGAYPLGADVGGTTNAQGELLIDDQTKLPVGLYLVQETSAGPHNIVAPAVPFLVGVPQPEGDGVWNYNVHVYPKNAILDAPEKKVDDSDAYELGDVVNWTITTDVPKLSEGNSYTDYAITDDLEGELDYVGVTVTGAGLADGDYTVTPASATADGPLVTVALTGSGLAKLNALSGPAEITVVVETTVNAIGSGTIQNEATVFVNDPDRTKGIDTNVVETFWGALKITKHAEGNEAKTLEGATFDLYAVDPAGAGATPIITGLKTGSNGSVQVDGLKEGGYWLVETAAPAGYQALTTPVTVAVKRGTVEQPNLYKIANTQEPPFTLPLTGGSGTLAFTLLGIGLIATAGGTFLVSRKRRATAAAKA